MKYATFDKFRNIDLLGLLIILIPNLKEKVVEDLVLPEE